MKEKLPVGSKLFSVSTDGGRVVVEHWRVTQHRGPVEARRACLLRTEPASPSPVRGTVELLLPSTIYATTLKAAIKNAIARMEARILRVLVYREEDKEDADLWKQYTKEIAEDRRAVTAMKKLLDFHTESA